MDLLFEAAYKDATLISKAIFRIENNEPLFVSLWDSK